MAPIYKSTPAILSSIVQICHLKGRAEVQEVIDWSNRIVGNGIIDKKELFKVVNEMLPWTHGLEALYSGKEINIDALIGFKWTYFSTPE